MEMGISNDNNSPGSLQQLPYIITETIGGMQSKNISDQGQNTSFEQVYYFISDLNHILVSKRNAYF